MLDSIPIQKYELELVKYPASSWRLFIVWMLSFTFVLVLPIYLTNIKDFPVWIFYVLMAIMIFLLWKFNNKFFYKYESTILIYDDYFQVNNQKYAWDEIEWFKGSLNSSMISGIELGIYNKERLKFYILDTSKGNLKKLLKLRRNVIDMLKQKGIQTRSYYDAKFHRRIAKLIIISNIILIAAMLLFQVAFPTSLPVIIFWAIVSLPYPIVIFMNQNVKAYLD